jgi:hypothetical protein
VLQRFAAMRRVDAGTTVRVTDFLAALSSAPIRSAAWCEVLV